MEPGGDVRPQRTVHFTELLDAINTGTNLSWVGPAPAVGGAVRAAHATTLRQAAGLGGVPPGGVIAAQHINEIRLRIRALE